MRITISLFLLTTTLVSFSQRVSFEDPDLTFSFKKPKNWQVFDDGYVVKVSPSAKDSATVYFTLTYFEYAQPIGALPTAKPANHSDEEDYVQTKVAGAAAKQRERMDGELTIINYTFVKFGQSFYLKTSTDNIADQRIFRKIIRSVQIKK